MANIWNHGELYMILQVLMSPTIIEAVRDGHGSSGRRKAARNVALAKSRVETMRRPEVKVAVEAISIEAARLAPGAGDISICRSRRFMDLRAIFARCFALVGWEILSKVVEKVALFFIKYRHLFYLSVFRLSIMYILPAATGPK